MNPEDVFHLRHENIAAIPIIHYNMETAGQVRMLFDLFKPGCVAVELAETMSLQLLHAASRLPDISIVVTHDSAQNPLYYLCEPCDAAFEGLRLALEHQLPAFCIDLDVDFYPDIKEHLPDPYAIQRIGMKHYFEVYQKCLSSEVLHPLDRERELYMARRLKELSLLYDKVLFIGGMAHIRNVLAHVSQTAFPPQKHVERNLIEICTLTEDSCREVMSEYGWISKHYEESRQSFGEKDLVEFPPDRQKMIYNLYKQSAENYTKATGNPFPGYHLRNIMKFARNYALTQDRLMPDLYQILSAAKGCVDHNYAYETWLLATSYPYRRNIDALPELNLSIEDVWGKSKILRFHLKQRGRKGRLFDRRKKDRSNIRFDPPGPFSICSYPPEDVIIENFADFLKKKGTQILTEEASRTVPFSTSIEDGIDTKETIRHWHEKKLYVKVRGKPPGGVGSIVIIFDEDYSEENKPVKEKYLWKTTWLGEHTQESDMAFYATPPSANVVGPGISRCEYGGFMMSYPPRRMHDVWRDPDYRECRSKPEILLMAAIDYAVKPLVVFVATKPPASRLKAFANRFGKKVVYIPIGQLSPITLNKVRTFHVLDGHDKRPQAGEYIF